MLINNAGVLRISRDVTKDGFEMHLGVNYLGQLLEYTHLSISQSLLNYFSLMAIFSGEPGLAGP